MLFISLLFFPTIHLLLSPSHTTFSLFITINIISSSSIRTSSSSHPNSSPSPPSSDPPQQNFQYSDSSNKTLPEFLPCLRQHRIEPEDGKSSTTQKEHREDGHQPKIAEHDENPVGSVTDDKDRSISVTITDPDNREQGSENEPDALRTMVGSKNGNGRGNSLQLAAANGEVPSAASGFHLACVRGDLAIGHVAPSRLRQQRVGFSSKKK
ncbi:hypothetical protein PIB30_029754 [Stylosanthes scabra]|uniref:Uncharacterized protein n=1 Tax=Stylosanthes scabra TaxID=79078 RepID=A0ABU6QAT4_9FABA|nr:hypothetical protein [Stylosanthes scabra]